MAVTFILPCSNNILFSFVKSVIWTVIMHLGIARSVHLSVPWSSCLGYRHAGCLQLSHHRPPEMCGLRTRPRTDVDPPRFLIGGETICHRRTAIGGGHIVSPPPGRYLAMFILLAVCEYLWYYRWLRVGALLPRQTWRLQTRRRCGQVLSTCTSLAPGTYIHTYFISATQSTHIK